MRFRRCTSKSNLYEKSGISPGLIYFCENVEIIYQIEKAVHIALIFVGVFVSFEFFFQNFPFFITEILEKIAEFPDCFYFFAGKTDFSFNSFLNNHFLYPLSFCDYNIPFSGKEVNTLF